MACADYTEGQTDQLGYHFIAFGLGHFNAPQKKVERNAMTRFVVQRKNNYSEVEAERDREAPEGARRPTRFRPPALLRFAAGH